MKIVSGGLLTVTETWLAEIRASRGFAGGDTQGAGGAGTFAVLQLFNPAASGKIVLVKAVLVKKPTSAAVRLLDHNAAEGSTVLDFGALLLGQADGVAQVRKGVPAAPGGTGIAAIEVEATRLTALPAEWLAEIPAGRGLTVANATVNEALAAAFFWVEV